MKICNLASGSKGNCTYLETKFYKILIDLGKNKKYIVDSLKSIGVNYKDINFVILTHSHDDHTSSLKTFMPSSNATLVLTNKIYKELKDLPECNILLYDDIIDIEGLNIKSLKMSHDTNDIRSFVIEEDNKKIVYVTDTGYVHSKYFKEFKNADVYYFEANHDVEMLTNGPYPEWLRARILSDKGHLSNNFAGIYLSKMIGDNTKYIELLHLSEHNNTEDLALKTVKDSLKDFNLNNIVIECTKQDEIGRIIEI